MPENSFPPLFRSELAASLASLQVYAQLLGKIRRALTPRQKHWWHVSLRAAAAGLTTTPIPADPWTFELLLDLTGHRLAITTSRGETWQQPLRGRSPAAFKADVLSALATMGVRPAIDESLFTSTAAGVYDPAVIERYWRALSQIDAIFKQFRGELRQETGPVQLWPHHLDLALLWFSGRLVPGVDPADEENADEQMNFGFAPGDDSVAEPYFYITAYPRPDGLTDAPLPAGAYWLGQGFAGAVLPYAALVAAADPAATLLGFLRAGHKAGASLMLNRAS